MISKRFKRVAAGVFVGALIIVGAALLRNHSANKPPTEESVETPKTPSAEGDDMRTPSNGAAAHGHEHAAEAESHETKPSDEKRFVEIEVPDLLRERSLDTTGDIGVFHQAHLAVKQALAQVKGGGMGLSDVYALIEGYDLNSDWKLYLRIYAKKQLGLPVTSREFWYISHATKALDNLFRARWSFEGIELSHRIRPILSTIDWAEVNAPLEGKPLIDRYHSVAWHGTPETPAPTGTVEKYMALDGRVKRLYDAFYGALDGLPSDSKVLGVFMENLAKGASAPPSRIEPSQAAPPAVETPGVESQAPPAAEVEAVERESSPRPSPTAPPAVESGPPAPPDAPHQRTPADPAAFEAAVSASIERYGVQEGMLRLAESHPEWRLRLFEWLRARQKRLAPPQPGNESE